MGNKIALMSVCTGIVSWLIREYPDYLTLEQFISFVVMVFISVSVAENFRQREQNGDQVRRGQTE